MPREFPINRDNVDYHGNCYQRGALDACEGRLPLPPLRHPIRYFRGYINIKLMPVTEFFENVRSLLGGWDMSEGVRDLRNQSNRPTSTGEKK